MVHMSPENSGGDVPGLSSFIIIPNIRPSESGANFRFRKYVALRHQLAAILMMRVSLPALTPAQDSGL